MFIRFKIGTLIKTAKGTIEVVDIALTDRGTDVTIELDKKESTRRIVDSKAFLRELHLEDSLNVKNPDEDFPRIYTKTGLNEGDDFVDEAAKCRAKASTELKRMLLDLDHGGATAIVLTGYNTSSEKRKFVLYRKKGHIRVVSTSDTGDVWKEITRIEWDKEPITFLCSEVLEDITIKTRSARHHEVLELLHKLPQDQQTNIRE